VSTGRNTRPSAITGEAKYTCPPTAVVHSTCKVSGARWSRLTPVRAGWFWYCAQPSAPAAASRVTVRAAVPATVISRLAGTWPPAVTTSRWVPTARGREDSPPGPVRSGGTGAPATVARAAGTGAAGPTTVPDTVCGLAEGSTTS